MKNIKTKNNISLFISFAIILGLISPSSIPRSFKLHVKTSSTFNSLLIKNTKPNQLHSGINSSLAKSVLSTIDSFISFNYKNLYSHQKVKFTQRNERDHAQSISQFFNYFSCNDSGALIIATAKPIFSFMNLSTKSFIRPSIFEIISKGTE